MKLAHQVPFHSRKWATNTSQLNEYEYVLAIKSNPVNPDKFVLCCYVNTYQKGEPKFQKQHFIRDWGQFGNRGERVKTLHLMKIHYRFSRVSDWNVVIDRESLESSSWWNALFMPNLVNTIDLWTLISRLMGIVCEKWRWKTSHINTHSYIITFGYYN